LTSSSSWKRQFTGLPHEGDEDLPRSLDASVGHGRGSGVVRRPAPGTQEKAAARTFEKHCGAGKRQVPVAEDEDAIRRVPGLQELSRSQKDFGGIAAPVAEE